MSPIDLRRFYDGLKINVDSRTIGLLQAVEDLMYSKQRVLACASAIIASVKDVL